MRSVVIAFAGLLAMAVLALAPSPAEAASWSERLAVADQPVQYSLAGDRDHRHHRDHHGWRGHNGGGWHGYRHGYYPRYYSYPRYYPVRPHVYYYPAPRYYVSPPPAYYYQYSQPGYYYGNSGFNFGFNLNID